MDDATVDRCVDFSKWTNSMQQEVVSNIKWGKRQKSGVFEYWRLKRVELLLFGFLVGK